MTTETPVAAAPSWLDAVLRVFISHDVEEHRALALQLASDLETLGAAAWLSSRDIPPGENWQSNIEQAFDESTHLLVLVGHPAPSKWVDEEIAMGRERMLQGDAEYSVIPILIESGAQLPRGLRRLQAVDVATSYSEGLSALATRLGLEGAMTGLQSRLLSEWEEGFSVLRRHGDVLRKQLNRIAFAVEKELAAVRRRGDEADAASGEAEKLRQAALRLETRARSQAALADAADKRAERASAEYSRAETTLAELQRSESEVEATHQPVLAKIDQAEQLLEQARHDGPLSVDRGGDVVALLEDPTQLVAPLNLTPRVTFDGFQQEYHLRGLILRVVQQATEGFPELRDVVLGCCTEALGADAQLPPSGDAAALETLAEDLTEAIGLYTMRYRSGYDAVDTLEIAVYSAFARLGGASRGDINQSASEARSNPRGPQTPPGQPPDAHFEVVVRAVPSATSPAERDALAQKIHAASRPASSKSDIDGFFAARKAAAGVDLPVTVLRTVDEQTALRRADTLRESGVDVLVRVATQTH